MKLRTPRVKFVRIVDSFNTNKEYAVPVSEIIEVVKVQSITSYDYSTAEERIKPIEQSVLEVTFYKYIDQLETLTIRLDAKQSERFYDTGIEIKYEESSQ